MQYLDTTKINNNVQLGDLHDGKTWIHYTPSLIQPSNKTINNKKETIMNVDNIKLTVFLITICTQQLEHSLKAINEINTTQPFLVNVIMNISPTNRAYNEMRLRCTTSYFIQNDEDMELLPNAINILYKHMNDDKHNKIFLNTFKLIDECLGIGKPPIIDCLKMYTNNIMKLYPTHENGEISVSSVDQLWHKQLIDDGYAYNATNKIIGYHGNHRTHFDLMLRHCKTLKSMINPNIKTNSGHLCKILRSLYKNYNDNLFKIVVEHFKLFCHINANLLNTCISQINTNVKQSSLNMYGITKQIKLDTYKQDVLDNFIESFFFELFDMHIDENMCETIFCIVSILCVATNNYEYSCDKYPVEIYQYFNDILYKKKNNSFVFMNSVNADNINKTDSNLIEIKYNKINKSYELLYD